MTKENLSPQTTELVLKVLTKTLRLKGLEEIVYKQETEPATLEMPFVERLTEALSTLVAQREVNKVQRMLNELGLANNLIDLEHLSYEPARNLNKNLIKELRSCRWTTDSVPAWITITGATGVGKTYLMKALVKQAVEKSLPAAYFRYSDLLRNLEAHIENKDVLSYRDKLNKRYKVLAIDDFGPCERRLDVFQEFNNLLDDRYAASSVIIGSQLPLGKWYEALGGGEHLKDALSDRIMAKTTISITLKGPSLRAPEPKPEETREKDIKR